MLYRKRNTNRQARTELPTTEMSLASSNKYSGASGDRNPAYNIEFELYDVIDEERIGYESLVNNPSDTPSVPSAYEVLGPEYLRVVG